MMFASCGGKDPKDDPDDPDNPGENPGVVFDIKKLPTNVEIVYTASYPSLQTYTLIKVGDEYYSKTVMNNATLEEFFLKKTGDSWTNYKREFGGLAGGWAQKATFTSTTFPNAVGSNDFLKRLIEPDDGAGASYNSSQAVSGGTETIAGISTNKKTLTTNVASFAYWRDPVTGLFLKFELKMTSPAITQTLLCTSWKTSGVSFAGITLP
jgi:hypothetical protein